jgi:endogenous inhibitor of DNA gyrase (YacG/DUF329 family)
MWDRVQPRLVVLGGVLAASLALSLYLWSSGSMTADVDNAVASMQETYTCPACQQVFLLTVAEATRERRSQGDVLCPRCGKPGATKDTSDFSSELYVGREREPTDEDAAAEPAQGQPSRPTPLGPVMQQRKSE